MSVNWEALNLLILADIFNQTSISAALDDPISQRQRIPPNTTLIWGFNTVNRRDFSDSSVSYPVSAWIFEVGTILATPTVEAVPGFADDQTILADPNFWKDPGGAGFVYQVIPGFPSVADDQSRIGNIMTYSVRVELAVNDPSPQGF